MKEGNIRKRNLGRTKCGKWGSVGDKEESRRIQQGGERILKKGEKKKETKFEEGAEAVIVRRTNSH